MTERTGADILVARIEHGDTMILVVQQGYSDEFRVTQMIQDKEQ